MTRIASSRRRFLTGLTTILVAPAVVRASSLMPISPMFDETAIREEIMQAAIRAMSVWLEEVFAGERRMSGMLNAAFNDALREGRELEPFRRSMSTQPIPAGVA